MKASSSRATAGPGSEVCDGVADLRQFMAGSQDVFWMADLSSGRLLFANPATHQLVDATLEELRADPAAWTSRVVEEDRAGLPEPFFAEDLAIVRAASANDDRAAALPIREYRMQRPNGQLCWIRDRRFIVRDAQGTPVRIGGVAEDVTDQKASELATAALLERERLARTEAEAVARSKDEFLSVVSHELRSPLNAIRGWAYVLRQVGGLSSVQERALDAIDRNTQAQARLVDDLLDSQSVLLGHFTLEMSPSMLAQVVDEAIDENRHAADLRHLSLKVAHDPSLQALNIDARRMRQAVSHLLSNAIKFTSAGGSVCVETRRVPEGAEIAVADTGIGIDSADLPHVFDRFAQVDGSYTRHHGGLGIGLSLTRQLVELHGGKVEARSEGKDRGATFVIRLPATEAASNAAACCGDASGDYPLEGCKIMVVEDDLDSREMLELILRETHADLVTFDSARRAYDYLAALPPDQRPDALVSDIAMPEEDGYSFIRRVRSLSWPPGTRPMVALALTAFARDEDRIRSMKAGFDVHIGKPIDSAVLVETLRSALVRNCAPMAGSPR